MRARRTARRANRAWPEPRPRPVGDEVVGRRAHDGDVDAVELGRVLRVGHPREGQEPGVVGPVGQAERLPPLQRVEHGTILRGAPAYPEAMWERVDRATFQSAIRAAALVFVAAWLFSDGVRAWVPVWVPILVLLAAEVEFVVRGRREDRRPGARVPPGPEDADLGFGELVEDEDGIWYLPPPARR